ncbi:uncharacterized protein LOC111627788 isoform X2 [Centruroides sculpturatus]|uniref:uncharacterized protein LOC111627788 isoform X2 n=1 Tax=Centruroides sculpturatus TaxID=218467 RepID=UPI000C6D6170|nr:uncharacterized protein LOC111627788 isoform X2 [Centruroides sculpturatus]
MERESEQINIYCSDGYKIRLSRSFLIQNCPEFNWKLFMDPTLGQSCIRVNVTSGIMNQVIEYLTDGEYEFRSVKDATDIYEISEKIGIVNLVDRCRDFLIEEMKVGNVCFIHDFACKHEDLFVQFHCWKLFTSSTDEVLESEDFLNCEESTVSRFLSRPIYRNKNEVSLFLNIYNWTTRRISRSNLQEASTSIENRELYRRTMQPFFHLIRFATMSRFNLENEVFNKNLLSDEEVEGLRIFDDSIATTPLPSTICQNTGHRRYQPQSFLFMYKNGRNLEFTEDKPLPRFSTFFCQVWVEEDCFVTCLSLPIYFKVILPKPLFLKAKSNSLFRVEVQNEELRMRNGIFLKKEAHCYVSDDEFDRMTRVAQNFPKWRKFWWKFYFDVDLFF